MLEYELSEILNDRNTVERFLEKQYGVTPLWTDTAAVPLLAYDSMQDKRFVPLYGLILPIGKNMRIRHKDNEFIFRPRSVVIGCVGDIDDAVNKALGFRSFRNVLKMGYNGQVKDDGHYTLLRN